MRKLLKLVNWDFAAGWFFCWLFYAYVGGGIAPAHATPIGYLPADANSYLAYIQEHHINVGISSPAKQLWMGDTVCQELREGMSPDQIIATSGNWLFDLPGIIDASRKELCP